MSGNDQTGNPAVLDRQAELIEQWRQAIGDEVPVLDLASDRVTLDPLATSGASNPSD